MTKFIVSKEKSLKTLDVDTSEMLSQFADIVITPRFVDISGMILEFNDLNLVPQSGPIGDISPIIRQFNASKTHPLTGHALYIFVMLAKVNATKEIPMSKPIIDILVNLITEKIKYQNLLRATNRVYLTCPKETDVLKMIDDTYHAYPQQWMLLRSINNCFKTYPKEPRLLVATAMTYFKNRKIPQLSTIINSLERDIPDLGKIITTLKYKVSIAPNESIDEYMEKLMPIAYSELETQLAAYQKKINQLIGNVYSNLHCSPSELIKRDLLNYFNGLALPFGITDSHFQYIAKETDDPYQLNPNHAALTDTVRLTFKNHLDHFELAKRIISNYVRKLDDPLMETIVSDIFNAGNPWFTTKGNLIHKIHCVIDNINHGIEQYM